MTSITEQLSATSKSHIESQLNLLDTVLRKSVEGVQQVVALNLNTARNVLERSTTTARELLDARDPREVLTLATKPLPTVEGLLSYGRELFGIASRAQVDLLQSASAQFRTLPGAPSAPLRLAGEAATQVATQVVPQVRDVTHEVVDNVAEATEAIEQGTAQATQAATEATTQAAQEAAAAAREAVRESARASAEAAAPVQQATEDVVAAASDNVQQATENVVAAASDNVEQATAAIAAAVAEAAPVTPAAVVSDDSSSASRTTRGKPSAKPVAQALAEIADKAPAKAAPGKNQPRK